MYQPQNGSGKDLQAPVVFIIFNRPEPTKKVFAAIAAAKPKKLFIVADGPRPNRIEDVEKCQLARAVTESVDWECEVHRNYAETNMGCGKRIASGLDWVFSQVEEAIIIEDDCVPTLSFFWFCQELLARYHDDTRVMQISGDNFNSHIQWTPYSYYFSELSHNWGWATWRRTWQHFDLYMKLWPEIKSAELLKCSSSNLEYRWLTRLFTHRYSNPFDNWDEQLLFCCRIQNGLTIMPSKNLVTNIGSGMDSTHTGLNNHYVNVPTDDIWHIKHPPYVIRCQQADCYDFDHF
ncbi:MAG TPA: glycosyltransferase family 2 protein, partial [Armatimonadota bacterium]|nr:glycosyltransferase family 2 protein [Armatimonadota bacterium]